MNLFKDNMPKFDTAFGAGKLCKLTSVLCLTFCAMVGVLASESYVPDNNKLAQKAKKSIELYVEPSFDFNTFKTITLDLLVMDQDENPVEGKIVKLSSLSTVMEEQNEEQQLSLLGMARTDSFGRVYQTIEIAQSTNQVVLELNVQSPNNSVAFTLNEQAYISHMFKLD